MLDDLTRKIFLEIKLFVLLMTQGRNHQNVEIVHPKIYVTSVAANKCCSAH